MFVYYKYVPYICIKQMRKRFLFETNKTMTTQINIIVEAIKETAIEMVKSGYSLNDVALQIANRFDNAIARLVITDIALDLGMKDQATKYLLQF